MRANSAHALYFHCACHRLQLASIQAAESNSEVKQVFGMMSNVWKLFYYSPKKAETLKEVQSALRLPELQIVKPSDTRWLSHERCMRAIKKELPALIVTLQQLYQATGDAEAFGLSALLSSYAVVSGIIFLAEVLDILAKINVAMQRKIIDFSKVPSFVKILVDELRSLKSEESEWCSTVQSTIIKLEEEYDIVVGAQRHGSTRSKSARISTLQEYRECVAIPYLDCLIENINRRFTDEAVKILSATSVFDPTKFPTEEALILAYVLKRSEFWQISMATMLL